MNNKWEKDCYYCVLSYMLVQTIHSNFDEGTEDIMNTIRILLEYPIQPLKRSYMQEAFEVIKPEPVPVVKVPKKNYAMNGSSLPFRKIGKSFDKRSKSIIKKTKEKKNGKETDEDRKTKMYFDHIISNQKLNGMEINPYGNTRFLKFVIGKGNNSILSRVALKTRWWWSEVKKNGFNFNFIWTQWKSNKIVDHLPLHSELKDAKSKDLKEDTAKHSDSEDMGSTSLSTNDTTTPKSSKLKRLNSDSAPNKWQYSPEPVSRSDLKMNKYQPKVDLDPMETETTIICNHVEGHVHLSNKKALFYNMKNYYESIGEDPFKYLPLTFHIKENLEDPEFEKFVQEFERLEKSDQERADALWEEKKRKAKPTNIWIIKPGENTNRGSGIQVCNTLEQIKNIGK
jgi:hypothetical protein